jgi:Ca2+-binding RTX toxin-like protein
MITSTPRSSTAHLGRRGWRSGQRTKVHGSNLDDTLIGGLGGDFIRGYSGDDSVYGSGGKDTLYGDEGRDRIDGGRSNDAIFGGSSTIRLIGGDGIDEMFGDGGNDLFYSSGDGANDNLFGGSGTDSATRRRRRSLRVDRGAAAVTVACYNSPPMPGRIGSSTTSWTIFTPTSSSSVSQ